VRLWFVVWAQRWRAIVCVFVVFLRFARCIVCQEWSSHTLCVVGLLKQPEALPTARRVAHMCARHVTMCAARENAERKIQITAARA
jgi:hypothetical protein